MEQQTASVMHPRYKDFLSFMTYCPHRTSQGSLEVAFWVWLNFVEVIDNNDLKNAEINRRKKEHDELLERFNKLDNYRDNLVKRTNEYFFTIQELKADLDRLHRERDSFQQQARVLAEEIERLTAMIGGTT